MAERMMTLGMDMQEQRTENYGGAVHEGRH